MPPLTTLIVDDELQSRSLIKKLLSIHFPKFITEEAETVEMAIEKIHQSKPELIFLDVRMKGETGFDLLDKIGNMENKLLERFRPYFKFSYNKNNQDEYRPTNVLF